MAGREASRVGAGYVSTENRHLAVCCSEDE